MNRTHRSLAGLLIGLSALALLASGHAADNAKEPEAQPRDFTKLQRGMTPEQVRSVVGAPKRIARQIFYHRYREQWVYDAPASIRLAFDCRRGQKPELIDIPSVASQKSR
jgi:hypothetical protein